MQDITSSTAGLSEAEKASLRKIEADKFVKWKSLKYLSALKALAHIFADGLGPDDDTLEGSTHLGLMKVIFGKSPEVMAKHVRQYARIFADRLD
jgi:hypothetical protein